jgi:hypothetical protein
MQRVSMAVALLFLFLAFAIRMSIPVLYLGKSAMGIDLIPGFSFGVWDLLQSEFLQ